jgi:DNA-binding XRE family transcriptional regulator
MLTEPPTPRGLLEDLSEHRQDRGMTRAELGAAVGVTASAIGLYERGRHTPSVEIYFRIVAAFGLHLSLSHDLVLATTTGDPT